MLDLSDAPHERIIKFIKDWLKLLSENRFADACSLLEPSPPAYGNTLWTPDLIKRIVAETFDPDSRFYRMHPEGPIFTDPYELEPQANRQIVVEFNNDDGYWVDYDMPFNHDWSDLTAQFEFHKTQDGYASILVDIHVL